MIGQRPRFDMAKEKENRSRDLRLVNENSE